MLRSIMASKRIAVALRRRTHQSKAGVVDDVLRLKLAGRKRLRNPSYCIAFDQIDRQHQRHACAGCLDLGGKRFEPILPSRDQNHRMAVAGEHPRKLGADSGRGSGYDGDWRHASALA